MHTHKNRKTYKLVVTHNMPGHNGFYYAAPLYFKQVGGLLNQVNTINRKFKRLHNSLSKNVFSNWRYTTTTLFSYNAFNKTLTLRLHATPIAITPQAIILNGKVVYANKGVTQC